jgi:hypothetical protein
VDANGLLDLISRKSLKLMVTYLPAFYGNLSVLGKRDCQTALGQGSDSPTLKLCYLSL